MAIHPATGGRRDVIRQGTAARLATYLGIAGVVLELTISANLLTWVGIAYVSDGGNLLVKLHPGTYAIGLGFAVLLAGHGAWSRLLADFWFACALAGMGACLVAMLLLTGTGHAIVLLDTFLPACLLAIVLRHATPGQHAWLRRAMQVLVAISAVLALGEMAEQATLVPLYLNNSAYYPHTEDFRPTALFDHPLTGALLTMMGLALCPRAGVSRIVFGTLMWAALLAFGGRTALAVSVLTVVINRLLSLARLVLSRDRRAVPGMAMMLAGLGAVGVLSGTALALGFGARVAGHLYWDDSAQVRLAQWQLLDELDCWQVLFGTRREDLLALLTPLWLGPGVEVIENFWLLMFVALGVVGFPLFVGSLGALLAGCWRRTVVDGRLLMLGVMVVASTSNSLGRKSTILVCLVATTASLSAGRRPRAIARGAGRLAWVTPDRALQGAPA